MKDIGTITKRMIASRAGDNKYHGRGSNGLAIDIIVVPPLILAPSSWPWHRTIASPLQIVQINILNATH